jgi:hypothetical protein
MVTEFRPEADFDAKQPGQDGLHFIDPRPAILVILTGNGILAAQERATDASGPAVVHADLMGPHDLPSGSGRHGRELLGARA